MDEFRAEGVTPTSLSDHPRRSEAAMLAAAIGDAMGWPHEATARRVANGQRRTTLGFEDWVKRSGGRFQPYEEEIACGSYSDDTQLLLAVCRVLSGSRKAWWTTLSEVELPFWLEYERGGGGATKRAAASWRHGTAPWRSSKEELRRQYLQAGGNGAAMRILPHVIRHQAAPTFEALAIDVVTDGICTHGHPRALVGSLAYAYALFVALRNEGTLSYGSVSKSVLDDQGMWSRLPDVHERFPDWLEVADAAGTYRQAWDVTVEEVLTLLSKGQDALGQGAVTDDREVLRAFGAFDAKVNGSGTVTSASAIFLMSRYAADPVEALQASALARGADTDTLASMTAALLGAALGDSWLRPFLPQLQDAEGIRGWTARVLDPRPLATESTSRDVRSFTRPFHGALSVEVPRFAVLPIGVNASVEAWTGVRSHDTAIAARAWKLNGEDGVTYYLKDIRRASKTTVDAGKGTVAAAGPRTVPRETKILGVGVQLTVSHLEISSRLYEDVLGMKPSKRSHRSISYGSAFAICQASPGQVVGGPLTIFVQVEDIVSCQRRLRAWRPEGAFAIVETSGRRFVELRDPDGNTVEVYERNYDPSASIAAERRDGR